jgi:hypothetical protein
VLTLPDLEPVCEFIHAGTWRCRRPATCTHVLCNPLHSEHDAHGSLSSTNCLVTCLSASTCAAAADPSRQPHCAWASFGASVVFYVVLLAVSSPSTRSDQCTIAYKHRRCITKHTSSQKGSHFLQVLLRD